MCQYCKVDGLQWKQLEGRWRLYYESGQPHLCRATRDKLLKAVARPKQSFWNEKELEKWRKRQPVTPPMPAEGSPEWFTWLCLEVEPKPKIARCEVAKCKPNCRSWCHDP